MAKPMPQALQRRRVPAATRPTTRGFTLIELLVAISVLAIVAVLGWRGLDTIVRARVAITSDMEQMRGMQLAFAQMQRDTAQVADLSTVPDRMPIVVEQGRIVLTRMVFAENQPTQVQLVAYELRNGQLSRRESQATRDLQALDTLWMAVTNDSGGAQRVVLQSNVTGMSVRTWLNDGAGWRTPGVDVISGAPSTSGTTLAIPTGIEVTVQLQDRPGNLTKICLLGAA